MKVTIKNKGSKVTLADIRATFDCYGSEPVYFERGGTIFRMVKTYHKDGLPYDYSKIAGSHPFGEIVRPDDVVTVISELEISWK